MENIDELKNIIQSANINFLIGSGLSSPYLCTLGNIEKNLTTIQQKNGIKSSVRNYINSSLLYLYFKDVMLKNKVVLNNDTDAQLQETLNNYSLFLGTINKILRKRGSTILSKQVNLFTTNIDVFLEKALDNLGLEVNDGFSGRLNPTFSLSNYNKIFSKRSLHFDNISNIPVFNLLKIHGSLNWKYGDNNDIVFSQDLNYLDKIKSLSKSCNFIDVEDTDTLQELIAKVDESKINLSRLSLFEKMYKKIPVVNPTKAKFRETILDLNYYELLRFYSNELEKETSVLFVMGFSMADEHIREITLRVAKSNPTLLIYIFAYDKSSEKEILKNLNIKGEKNIKILSPKAGEVYDFATINTECFEQILNKIEK